ncbi:MAG: cellulose biosynthesis cyclic di-GMP-binding regulatory protein BcsB [Chloroflexota bacterium]
MNKKLPSPAIALMLLITLLAASFIPAQAQAPLEDGIITVGQLEGSEILLLGPYDTETLYFGLPADWSMTGDAQLDLNVTAAFNAAAVGNAPAVFGGLLTVRFNRNTVAILPISNAGTFDLNVTIPQALLVSPRPDGRMELRFELDSGISCQANQHMNLVINTGSRLAFAYEKVQPGTDLINFPRPIFQDTIFPDSATIVIPDQPSAAELQSALTVAAGLGNLTSSELGLGLTTASQLSQAQQASDHIIFVGKAGSLPQLAELDLALAAANGSFAPAGGSPDDGVVQMANSPWNVSRVVLVVSGNSDAAVVKAAQAVSTGVLQSNSAPNLAVIEEVKDQPLASPLVSNQTFADLGYEQDLLTDRGVSTAGYNFYVPTGSTVSSEAFLELAFGHSALMDYNLSGVVVLLNNQPIGSIKFTAETAAQAINTAHFALPQSLVLPGNNRIDVRVSLEPLDNCTDPTLEGLFAVIWPESRLFLPFTTIQMNTVNLVDLGNYPTPLSFDATMGSLAFLLQGNDLGAWQGALQIAKFLGDRTNGPIAMPRVFFDGQAAAEELANYNLVVIGRPSELAAMGELNPVLPVSFAEGSDQVASDYSQVAYRIPADVPQGYVQLLTSPWNNERVVFAALGNTPEGIAWAASSLADSPLRGQLAGNFALINRTQVRTADTRLGQPLEETAEQLPVELPVAPGPVDIDLTPPPANQPAWILPTLGVAAGLVFIILLVVLVNSTRSRRI